MTPTATGIAESALYVDDLDRALDFYLKLLGSEVIHHDERFCALRVAEEQTLLLFKRGATREDAVLPFGTIISHDGSGPLHICFGMAAGETGAWEARLKELGGLAERREQPVFPRSGRACAGTGHAAALARFRQGGGRGEAVGLTCEPATRKERAP